MNVRFTPSAKKQFLAGLAYIRQDNPQAAQRLYKLAQQRLSRLKKFPNSGRRIPEFPEAPYRELILPPYRFFYQVRDKVVWIIAVWHGAQLPSEPTRKQGH